MPSQFFSRAALGLAAMAAVAAGPALAQVPAPPSPATTPPALTAAHQHVLHQLGESLPDIAPNGPAVDATHH